MQTNQSSWVARSFDFPLLEGGPLYRLLSRAGLTRPEGQWPISCAVVFILITWVPMLILAWMQGVAYGDKVRIPLLMDFAAYTRFLISMPLLILAEAAVAPRLSGAASSLIQRGLVRDGDRQAWQTITNRTLQLRDSNWAEFAILILAYLGTLSAVMILPSNASTWHLLGGAVPSPSLAGWWWVLIGLPLFQFLIYRWFWRLLIWYSFLWRTSRLDLNLTPTHFDAAGGLGSVGGAQEGFGLLALALMAGPAGVFAREIFLNRIPLGEYKFIIAGLVVLMLCVFLGPLFMFSPHLVAARRAGLREYGLLATVYCRAFDAKWMGGQRPGDEALLGTSDIQSLADLGNSYAFVSRMRTVPFGIRTAALLALASLAPMLPLVTSVVPLRDVFDLFLKILF